MNKRKLKLFLKIFFLLLAIQLVVVILHILLNNADNSLASITAMIISVISVPMSFVSRDLPFYSGEGIFVRLLFWGLNLTIQTTAIYAGVRIMKKIK